MTYFLNLFSPETYEAFSASDRTISGFRARQRAAAGKIRPGDRLVCYMTRLSRWIGVLEVEEGPFEDSTPIFYDEDDPFVVRFRVRPVVWLSKDRAEPIHHDEVWNALTFTRGHDKKSSTWTGKLRASLSRMEEEDGSFLEELIFRQGTNGVSYPVDEDEYRKLVTHRVRRLDRTVSVSVPEAEEVNSAESVSVESSEARESHKMQALVAEIGSKMGLKIWVPRNDRVRVHELMDDASPPILDLLPLNYDDTTLKTIEQIDVLWLRGRAIVRAFEIEHTTSVYSGILRMADLLALQPNMDIKLHIVAPVVRREKVFTEIRRPVFSLLDRGPLAESCTFISYDSLQELSGLRHLAHFSDSVLEEYAEEAE
jgi:predicted RNA-binding protein